MAHIRWTKGGPEVTIPEPPEDAPYEHLRDYVTLAAIPGEFLYRPPSVRLVSGYVQRWAVQDVVVKLEGRMEGMGPELVEALRELERTAVEQDGP